MLFDTRRVCTWDTFRTYAVNIRKKNKTCKPAGRHEDTGRWTVVADLPIKDCTSLRMHRTRQRVKSETLIDRGSFKVEHDDEDMCDDENDTILPFCEVNIKHEEDDIWCVGSDGDEELVHLSDQNEADDVHGDYSCQKCNICFTTWSMLKKHTKSAHDAIQCYKCKICLKVYNELVAFELHVVADHGTGTNCTDDFLEKLTLYRVSRGTSFYTRVKRRHNADRQTYVISNFKKIANVLSCSRCHYKTNNKRWLAQHVALHLDGEFACKTCKRVFAKRRDLMYHVKFSHREITMICNLCGQTFRNNKLLDAHRKLLHFGGKYECKTCKKLLANQKNLDIHVVRCRIQKKKSKHGKMAKDVVCDVCGKVFGNTGTLNAHMRVHTGAKPHRCVVCKEAFAKSNSLRQHLLLHTGAKPYVCDICGKAFAQKPGLTGHRRSHPGPHPPLPPVFINPIIDDLLKQCEQ